MKRILRLALSAVFIVGCVFVLASCGKRPSGTYTYEDTKGAITQIYEFSRKTYKVYYSGNVADFGESLVSEEGTYKVSKASDGSLQITFTVVAAGKEITVDPLSYEKGDGYIMIDGIKYIKQKK